MTEKLKVSREVADAIECVKRECYGFDSVINIHIKNGWTSEEKLALRKLSTEEFVTALIVGYEVEMTSHEVIAVEAVDEACEVADSALYRTKEEMIDFALDTRNYELFMQLTSEQTDA